MEPQSLGTLARIAVGTLPQALRTGWPITIEWKRLVAQQVEFEHRLMLLESVTGMPAEWWRPHAVAMWREMSDPVPWEITVVQTVDLMISWVSPGSCEWPSRWPDYVLR